MCILNIIEDVSSLKVIMWHFIKYPFVKNSLSLDFFKSVDIIIF